MSSTDAPEEGAQRKPFAAFITEQRGGGLHGELSDALAELVLACLETGKKGKLVLEVAVASNKDLATVTVTDKIKVTAPEIDRGAAIYFADEDGNLSRRNPRQMELGDLREASKKESA